MPDPLKRPTADAVAAALLAGLVVLMLGCQGAGRLDSPSPGAADSAAELVYLRGRNAIEEGLWDLARVAFAEALAAEPEHQESLRWAGLAWSSGAGQSAGRALEYFEGWLAARPRDEEIRWRAIQLARFTGDLERARSLATELGDSYEASVLRAHLELDRDPAAAVAAARRALESSAGSAGAHALMALASEQAGDFETALDHARLAAALDPLDSRNHYRLGLLLRRTQDLDGARRALETQHMVARLAGEGSLRPPSAIEALRLLRELEERVDASAISFRRRLLRELIATGRRDEAIRVLGELPDETIDLDLAALARRLGATPRALSCYRRLCDAAGSGPEASGESSLLGRGREACFQLAVLALESGNRVEAEATVEAILVKEPWVARFLGLRARLAEADGRTHEATAALERALEVAPWRAEDRVLLAELHRRHGDAVASRRVLDGAREAETMMEGSGRADDPD